MFVGGMKSDIFSSMAEGVSGSACLVCFMTQAYQDSKNCALELKFVRFFVYSALPVVRALSFDMHLALCRVPCLHLWSQATQTGVPVVPVMMEAPDASGRPWVAGGWLGIIMAGALW